MHQTVPDFSFPYLINAGDNFFKSASYAIEVMCAEPFSEEKEKLKDVEAKIISKRAELSKFESEYREVLAKFTEMTSRYAQEMQAVRSTLLPPLICVKLWTFSLISFYGTACSCRWMLYYPLL